MLFGNAVSTSDGAIELTSLDKWQGGSTWLDKKIKTQNGFSISMKYWAGGGRDLEYGGADGIVISFCKQPVTGNSGGEMGFAGTGAYGVELDSFIYNDNDPAGKHIAIIKDSGTNQNCPYRRD